MNWKKTKDGELLSEGGRFAIRKHATQRFYILFDGAEPVTTKTRLKNVKKCAELIVIAEENCGGNVTKIVRQCSRCDTTDGNGVEIYDCDNCGALVCTVHSDNAPEQQVLCDGCAPDEEEP